MGFGNNQPERSRKRDIIKRIQINMVCRMVLKDALEATRWYGRRTLAELENLLHEEMAAFPPDRGAEQ